MQLGSPLSLVSELLEDSDFLSVLTADPESEVDLTERPTQAGISAGGIEKLLEAGKIRRQKGFRFELEAEGGIGREQVAELASAGADILVSGIAIFQGGQPAARLKELIRTADRADHPRSGAPEPASAKEFDSF